MCTFAASFPHVFLTGKRVGKHKLEQAKKAGKGEKCQSDLFFPKKLISGYLLKAKKPKKGLKSYQKL
jgi:hypothetical protein